MYQIQFSRGLDALPLAKELRRKVFITEQGFQNEFDDIDRTAWHVLISEAAFPVEPDECSKRRPAQAATTWEESRWKGIIENSTLALWF